MTRASALALALACAAGCLAKSLDQEAIDALGPETTEPGPRHRPGQPCLVCHGEGNPSEARTAVLGGTVYQHASDANGVGNVDVRITDADGTIFEVHSNTVGNFMVVVDPGVGQPLEGEGVLSVPAAPVFPLTVDVTDGLTVTPMRNAIQREGSCAACHTAPAGAGSNGRVYLQP